VTRLTLAEIFKLRRRLLTKLLAGLLVLIFAGGQFARWQATDYAGQLIQDSGSVEVTPEGDIVTPGDPQFGRGRRLEIKDSEVRRLYLEETVSENLSVVRWIGLVFGVMLVAGAVGSEYSWGTLRPFLTCAESREKYLAAKFLAIGLLLAAGLAGALLLAIVTSLFVAAVNGGLELDFVDGAYVREAVTDFGRTLFVLVPYLLIAGLAGVAGRSAMVAAVVGLILFSVEGALSSALEQSERWVHHIPDYLLLRNADAVVGTGAEEINGRLIEAPEPWVGALVLVAYAVAAFALALLIFKRRDITA